VVSRPGCVQKTIACERDLAGVENCFGHLAMAGSFGLLHCEEEVAPCSVSLPKKRFLGMKRDRPDQTPSRSIVAKQLPQTHAREIHGCRSGLAMATPRSWSRSVTENERTAGHRPGLDNRSRVRCLAVRTRADQDPSHHLGFWASIHPCSCRTDLGHINLART